MSKRTRPRGRPPTFDRETALSAAVSLFWRHGYEGTSIAMLTAAMGTTAPTLYAAFGSKDELFREALARYQGHDSGASTTPVKPVDAKFIEKLERYLTTTARQFISPNKPKGCMVLIGALQHGPEGDAAAAATTCARDQTLQRFRRELENSMRTGEIPAGVNCGALARFYCAIVQGMAVQATDGASLEDLDSIANLALSVWPKLIDDNRS
jgi:AcrR family transcriptional regulator